MTNPLNWLNPSEPAPEPEAPVLCNTLFGDVPAEQWPRPLAPGRDPAQEAPEWQWFRQAREAAQRGETPLAEQLLRQVLSQPDLEARHYLQAWTALRALGVAPAATEAKQVLGVVVEVALTQGPDVIAAYADGSARYINQGGGAVVWENPDHSLDALLNPLLAAGQHVADQIGPWEGARLGPPTDGRARINLLTPSGLHFGEGPMNVLWNDALAHPVLAAAQALMMAIMEKSRPGITGQN